MKAKLVCLDAVCPESDVLIDHFPVVIGRGPDADVSLKDEWVSRTHCLLTAENDLLRVRDLGSRHGTFINGERVVEAPLYPADMLGMGLSTFRVDYGPDARLPVPPDRAERRRRWSLARSAERFSKS